MFSYIVAERRGEIGIRMALGAQRLGVLAHVMKEGLVLAAIAVAVGLAAAYVLSGLIASLLFGVRPIDVPTAAAVAGTMIIVAAVACLLGCITDQPGSKASSAESHISQPINLLRAPVSERCIPAAVGGAIPMESPADSS